MANSKRVTNSQRTASPTPGKSAAKNSIQGSHVAESEVTYLLDIKKPQKPQSQNTSRMLIELVRKGVTKSAYDKMLEATGLSATELADLIHISSRTLRRYQPNQTFSVEQSERMVALASLYSRGAAVFERIERFNEWVSRPQLAFGNEPPKNYLDTSIGINMILDELGRIEYGIFA